jgi:hypothetical protein
MSTATDGEKHTYGKRWNATDKISWIENMSPRNVRKSSLKSESQTHRYSYCIIADRTSERFVMNDNKTVSKTQHDNWTW